MYKLDKILQKVFIIIGILALILFLFTFPFIIRKNYVMHELATRTTAAEPSRSVEWYQAAGQKLPE